MAKNVSKGENRRRPLLDICRGITRQANDTNDRGIRQRRLFMKRVGELDICAQETARVAQAQAVVRLLQRSPKRGHLRFMSVTP